MKENIIRVRSFTFAMNIVAQYKRLTNDKKEFVMSKQLLRAGTSIGSNVREAEHAESKPDFIHKLSIALKEANETEYWLDLLYHSDYMDQEEYSILKSKNEELLRLLTSIIITSKNK